MQLRRSVAPMVTGLMVLTFAAPTAAAPSATAYHGIFTPVVEFRCPEVAPAPDAFVASGTWNVIVRDDQATVTINILVNGRHHVSFHTLAPSVTPLPGEQFLVGKIQTGAGDLWLSLVDHAFSYDFPSYDFSQWGGINCPGGVTYHGLLEGSR